MGNIFCCCKEVKENDKEVIMNSGTSKTDSLKDSRRRKFEIEQKKQQDKLEQLKIIQQQMKESDEGIIITDNKFNEIIGETVEPTKYINNNNIEQNNMNNNINYSNLNNNLISNNIDNNQTSNKVNSNIELIKNLI